jgi:hypothetical protein
VETTHFVNHLRIGSRNRVAQSGRAIGSRNRLAQSAREIGSRNQVDRSGIEKDPRYRVYRKEERLGDYPSARNHDPVPLSARLNGAVVKPRQLYRPAVLMEKS